MDYITLICLLLSIGVTVLACITGKRGSHHSSGSRHSSSEEVQKSYSDVAEEVIQRLERLQKFCRAIPDIGSYVDLVPVDVYGNHYGNGGNYPVNQIKVTLVFGNRFDSLPLSYIDQCADEAGTDNFFRIEQQYGSHVYATTTLWRFKGKYKKFMPVLYNTLRRRFPEFNMKLDGDRIVIYNFK